MTPVPADPNRPSPVDQILASPPGKSLLDTTSAEPVPKWMWLLPAVFLLPGAIMGWLLVRGSNRTAGRVMLVVGVILTIATLLTIGPTNDILDALRR